MASEFDKNNPKAPELTPEEMEVVKKLNMEKSAKKGTILLREGDDSTNTFFVLSGCIRQYYLVDGEEKTTEFFTEDQSIFPAGPSSTISKFYLECVEDTKYTITSASQQKEIYEKFPRFESLCRIATEQEFAEYQEKAAKYMISSPEERYLNLIDTRPDLLNRVPQYQLASYLGVKPESLSRIRKRLSQKK